MNIDWSKAPEGATHFHPKLEGKFGERFFMKTDHGWRVWYMGEWHASTPHLSGIDTARFVERQAEWTGTGLPPVGTVCECQDSNLRWKQGTIIHIGPDRGTKIAVMQCDDEILWGEVGEFRAIKTQEQIEEEERESKVQAMLEITTALHISNMREAMEELYREGYRKQPKEDA